ncbi:prepilin-type N-terminal cleavage/methylation domain-containing protein [bacterium]|nr:prepilin-type N-terminal cleavage/methylation domain-containing protein [bacterium]
MTERLARIRAPRAFTLVELMMVIIVMSIIAAVTVPDIKSAADRVRLDSGARRIADLCDFGYRSAVGTGRVHALILEADRRHYMLVAEAPPQNRGEDAPAESSATAPPQAGELQPVRLPGTIGNELPEGIVLASVSMLDETLAHDTSRMRILFFPDGTTEFATLTLSDQFGNKRNVVLNGLSGTIKIEEPAPGRELPADEQLPPDQPMGAGNGPQPL